MKKPKVRDMRRRRLTLNNSDQLELLLANMLAMDWVRQRQSVSTVKSVKRCDDNIEAAEMDDSM